MAVVACIVILLDEAVLEGAVLACFPTVSSAASSGASVVISWSAPPLLAAAFAAGWAGLSLALPFSTADAEGRAAVLKAMDDGPATLLDALAMLVWRAPDAAGQEWYTVSSKYRGKRQ